MDVSNTERVSQLQRRHADDVGRKHNPTLGVKVALIAYRPAT
eukprot:gene4181-4031_t